MRPVRGLGPDCVCCAPGLGDDEGGGVGVRDDDDDPSGNKNKLAEVRAILGAILPGGSASIRSQSIDLPELQGTGDHICAAKAREAAQRVGGPVLIEDTELRFDALGGMPGPYIKWFLEAVGPQGLHRMLAGFDDKRATARCTFVLCMGPGQEPLAAFHGDVRGTIVSPRGDNNFGWDPVFQRDEQNEQGLTFAQMPPEQKNALSHRRLALEGVRAWLTAHPDAFC
eukprot:m51a1_g11878 nucleoside-triphosphate diphosphatase, putative (226) ;mRNA; f:568775-570550